PVSNATTAAKSKTRISSVGLLNNRPLPVAKKLVRNAPPQLANNSPSSPPTETSHRLSVNTSRNSLQRLTRRPRHRAGPLGRALRQTERKLLATRCGARQPQARHIGTSNQRRHRDHAHPRLQVPGELSPQPVQPSASRSQFDAGVGVAPHYGRHRSFIHKGLK